MFVVHVGTTEEWHIVNVTQEIHDFHIHQIHFVVERINGVKVEHPLLGRQRRHSPPLPGRQPRRTGHARPVDGFPLDPLIKGEFLFHCHILDHEDEGMMAKIEAI